MLEGVEIPDKRIVPVSLRSLLLARREGVLRADSAGGLATELRRILSAAEIEGSVDGSASRTQVSRRRRREALEERDVVVELDLSRCPSPAQRRHVSGRGGEVVVERQEVSGAA
jgi:hypothetical protein